MYDLAVIVAFRKVAETGNFTVAAQDLRVTPSAVSRQITRLEESLGVQLLIRTTRHLRLTKLGEQFYRNCAKGLVEVEHAIQIVSRVREEPHGVLRIGVTPFFGKAHLMPAILDFLGTHPKVTVDVTLSHSEVSFHESGVDVLVRAGSVRGRSIAHEDLAPMRHVVCATPGYLKKHGVPRTPKDLMRHNCLLSTRPNPMSEWPFKRGPRKEYVPVSGNLRTDSVEALYRAVMSGAGIARLADYVIGPELRSGELRSLFSDRTGADRSPPYETTTNTMKAYYLRSRFPDPKTRAFIRFIKTRFQSNYDWEHRDGAI
jgi:DNA-binding transcriptional LysR family regulator